MPLYEYSCRACSNRFSAVARVVDRREVRCARCGSTPEIVIQPPAVRKEFDAFVSPATGKVVDSWTRLNNDLKESGCHIRERGEEKDIARTRKEIATREATRYEELVSKTAQELGL